MSIVADSTLKTSSSNPPPSIWGNGDESFEVGDSIVYKDAETGGLYVKRFDSMNRTVNVPISQAEVSLLGATGSGNKVPLPSKIEHGGSSEQIFNAFRVMPNEDGSMMLEAAYVDPNSTDTKPTWLSLGPLPADGFDDLVPGVVLRVPNSDGGEAFYSTLNAPKSAGADAMLANNYQLLPPSDTPIQMLDDAGNKVTLKDVPTVQDNSVDGKPVPKELDKIVVVETSDGRKVYHGIDVAVDKDGATQNHVYNMGYAPDDAPVGVFSSATADAEGEKAKFNPMYAGKHNSGGFENGSTKIGNKEVVLFDENNTGSIDDPHGQGKSADRAVVTQYYDSENNPITYYLNGGSGGHNMDNIGFLGAFGRVGKSTDGQDDDTLTLPVGPGGADEWKISEGHTVDGEPGYTKYFHEPTQATVYAKEYENIQYVEIEPQPIPDDHFSSSDVSKSSQKKYSGHFDIQANSANYEKGQTRLASDSQVAPENKRAFSFENSKFEYPYDTSKMTQYHAFEGDRLKNRNDHEYRANVLVDENGPVLHVISLADGIDSVVLPGKLSDYAVLTKEQLNGTMGFVGDTVMVHKETGALFDMSGVEEIHYTEGYDKIKQ